MADDSPRGLTLGELTEVLRAVLLSGFMLLLGAPVAAVFLPLTADFLSNLVLWALAELVVTGTLFAVALYGRRRLDELKQRDRDPTDEDEEEETSDVLAGCTAAGKRHGFGALGDCFAVFSSLYLSVVFAVCTKESMHAEGKEHQLQIFAGLAVVCFALMVWALARYGRYLHVLFDRD